MTRPRFALGVLFVHGIGTQPWGDMLVRWGDSLVQTIARATGREALATVERAGPRESADDGTAEAWLRIDAGGRTERWLLSEGWWADAFPPPTYSELVSWSLRALPWAVALHFARGYWRDSASGGRSGQVLAFLRAGAKLIVMLPLTPLIMLLLASSLILGLIPPLRGWILALQSSLTSTMGDTLAFVESPVRAALIRTRLLERLSAVSACCEHTIVIAHSQGAAAVLDALGGIADPNEDRAPVPPDVMPDTLVTFGSGINQLASQRVVSAGLVPRDKGSAWVVMAFALVVMGAIAWLAGRVWTEQTTVGGILAALGLVAAGFLGTVLMVGASLTALERAAAHFPLVKRHHEKVTLTVGLALFFLFPALLVAVDDTVIDADNAVLPLLALTMLIVSTGDLLSKRLETAVKRPVITPPGLRHWFDLHASHDPVPNGATATREPGMPVDTSVSNRGSMFTDHTTYWENEDGFVLRVARACALTASSTWAGALSHDLTGIDARAGWRVGFLKLARAAGTTLWLVIAGLLFWTGRQIQIPAPLELPAWVPAAAARPALLATLIGVGAWISHAVVFAIWRWWVRREQTAALEHRAVEGSALVPMVAMGTIVWLLVAGALALAWPLVTALLGPALSRELSQPIGAYRVAVLAFIASAVASWLSALVLVRSHRPPRVAATAHETAVSA